MNITETSIAGLVILEPRVFADSRGSFHESFNKKTFNQLVTDTNFVQDNQSTSAKNVLRGLHFQTPPFAQAKLVSVVRGSALDVAVDLRKDSRTYGQWESVKLTGDNKKQFFIPRGFAHGFLALEEGTLFCYKCDNFYSKEHEDSLMWNDPDLNIDWGVSEPLLSEKDLEAKQFNGYNSPFSL